MVSSRQWLGVVMAGVLAACSQELPAADVGVVSEALGPCNETVPANRNVDGVPAYAQCSGTENSAIYSNNGVDTSVTQSGSDWVKTQWSGGYQCTELAHRYLYFRWNVKWIPNGNAGLWCDTQPPASSGVVQSMTPVHGDIMVLAPGSCGADATTGHVNVVDTVDMAGGKLSAVEQNRAGRNNYKLSCAKCFLHVMANDGTPKPIAAAPAAAGAPAPAVPAAGSGAVVGRPAEPQGRAGAGALPSLPRPSAQPSAAGAPAVVAPQPSTPAPSTPAPSTPAATPVSPTLLGQGAGGSAALAPSVQPAPSTRATAPAASGCSAAGGSQRAVRPSLVSAGLWLFVLAAWSFRRRGRRALGARVS